MSPAVPEVKLSVVLTYYPHITDCKSELNFPLTEADELDFDLNYLTVS